jgi:Cu(I)/Ag(I) efflux system membrane fusion protein/cobalt-zinc-cadmium efflux system membrane fusion protein
MNPSEIYDKPGKSAMGMDLVPVYAEEVAGGPGITIDPVIQQNMGIRTAPVRKGPLVHTIRTYGHITADETRTVRVSPKTSGWIEKLYVDFTGKFVEKGDPLFELYAPKLVAAQEEYLVARRTLSTGAPQGRGDLLKSALRRLTYFDVAESEIREIEEAGIMKKALMIRSPSTGHVIRKTVEEGDFIREGTMIFRISDLSRVWVEAHIFEYELPWIRKGQEAEMILSYIPGKIFVGKVTFVYPYLQPETRDVVVRLEFENPDLELKPDMYADVLIKPMADEQGLIIPSEAVIRSGIRNIVFVVQGDGKFSPRDVVLGRHLDDGNIEILAGVFDGETVVTSGQFLLDSESKLKEAVQKMLDAQVKKQAEDDFFKDME